MARLDTWKPEDKEEWGEELDSLLPSSETLKRQEEILVRKAKEFQTRSLFIERRATLRTMKEDFGDFDQKKGECQYCLAPTQRDFCTETCERDAAFAALPIKFHTKGG
jgi:hypothetical protein